MHASQLKVETVEFTEEVPVDVAIIKSQGVQTLRILDADKETDIRQVLKDFGFIDGSISLTENDKIQSANLSKTVRNAVQYFVNLDEM